MTDVPLSEPDPFAAYTSAGVVSLRSRVNLIWCAADANIHEVVDEPVDFAARLAELDALGCGPHRVEALCYPFIGSEVAVQTSAGVYAVGTLCDDPGEFDRLLAGGIPVPWAIVLPDHTTIKLTIDPNLILALFVAFTGTKTFGDTQVSVEDAYAQLDSWHAKPTDGTS